jgi:(E)-4-hydroxy-3-methylbut-2-enyl-diphosphate synthase
MQANSTKLLHVIKPYIDLKPKKITVAIMGCLVNGLNEAKNADIGIYGLKNKFVIYANHKKIGTFDFTHTLKTFKSIYNAM